MLEMWQKISLRKLRFSSFKLIIFFCPTLHFYCCFQFYKSRMVLKSLAVLSVGSLFISLWIKSNFPTPTLIQRKRQTFEYNNPQMEIDTCTEHSLREREREIQTYTNVERDVKSDECTRKWDRRRHKNEGRREKEMKKGREKRGGSGVGQWERERDSRGE